MKFSFRYTLAIIIFILLTALVSQQVLIDYKNNPEKSFSQIIIQNINPFWQSPDIFEASKKPIIIPITIENPLPNKMIVTGKVELFDNNNNVIPKIGVIGESMSQSGILVDYLSINPENIAIEPNITHTFQVLWRGFGDQFIDATTDKPTITFTNLSDTFQDQNEFRFAFYEKLREKILHFSTSVKVSLTTLDESTGISEPQINDPYNFNIPYITLEKTLNTGLILNFGLILIFALILWKHFSRKNNQKIAKISEYTITREEIEILEKETKLEIENIKNKKLHPKTIKKIKKTQEKTQK